MPKIGFDTDIYSNDGTTWYGGDDMLDMGFTITVQSNKLVGQFQASRNGATLDNGDLILPFNILGLTQTINKQTPDDGMAVGDSITTYNGQMSGSVALYVVPAPESDITPKAVSLDNLQTFKEKCDDTYAKKTEIPEEYTLPVANASTLGGVKPVAKTSEMTQNVGVDSNGVLYTKPAPDISEQVSDLSQSVDDIYTILQQEVYNAQDIEQEYSSRETADGADIIDGALETVKKIQGSTVKTTNLIPFPYEGATTTVNGVTFTNNGDGSVTINGTATRYATFTFCADADKMNLLAGTTYYFTCAHGVLSYHDADGTHYIFAESGSSFAWGADWVFDAIYIQLNEGMSETNLTVYPMLNEGSSALPYMPYFPGLKNAYFQGLRSTGRNLFNINQTPFYSTNANYSVDGNTFTATATGTNAHIQFRVPTIIGEQYTISVGDLIRENFSEGFGLFISPNSYQDDASYIDLGTNQSHTFTATSEWCYIKFYVAYYYNSESPGTITFSNLMLNYGSSALPYEPYIAHEISLDTAIELPAWDSINPTTGKRIVGTNTVYLDEIDDWTVSSNEYEGKTAFRAGTYPNIVVHTSQNPKAICSRLPFSYTIATNKSAGEAWAIANSTNYIYVSIFNSRLSSLDSAGLKAYFTQERNAGNPYVVSFIVEPTESDISMEDRLPAYKNGSETVIQGATDNSKYGAENTLTQNYAEVKGTTKGGNS